MKVKAFKITSQPSGDKMKGKRGRYLKIFMKNNGKNNLRKWVTNFEWKLKISFRAKSNMASYTRTVAA